MANVVQRSFASGELAPALYARTDQAKYANALRTLRNMHVLKHGGAQSRAGTQFICEVKNSALVARLIEFIFNAEQTYVLEFGEFYMRVIRDGVQLTASSVIAWNNGTAYLVGDLASRLGVNYYCILAHTNHQPPNATYWYPLTGNIYEIPTPYLAADLAALNYVQSADVITIVHPDYAPRNLSRFGDTDWTLAPLTFAPAIAAPTTVNVSGGDVGPTLYWAVTAVADETYEESLQSSLFGTSNNVPTVALPTTVTWIAVVGAQAYNVYRSTDGATYGFIGSALSNTFNDIGLTPDTSVSPPQARNPFPNTGDDWPSVVGYYQQRRLFGSTPSHPETVWGSRSANFDNFTISSPLQDDDSVTFTVAGAQVNVIRALIDLDKLLIPTSGSIYTAEGDADGVLLPGAVNLRKRSSHGSAELAPLVLGTSLLYVQARGAIIRDLINDALEGLQGNDLTIFSAHLFEGYSIRDWAYQEIPNSVAYIVRSDGTLIGLTYIPEQALVGWHHHDTDGVFENVRVVPEGLEDRVYVIVKRTINGVEKRYIERFRTRLLGDIREMCLVDSGLMYDGRNTDLVFLKNMGFIGGTTWNYPEVILLQCNSAVFTAGDIGNEFHFFAADGITVTMRATVISYTSATQVMARPDRLVPLELRNSAHPRWARAVDQIAGLAHLEGKDISVFADGFVVASPNNDEYEVLTVASGTVTLPRCFAVIWAGLPYITDFETLDIDTPQGASLKDKNMLVNRVGLFVQDTRGVFVGQQAPEGALNNDDNNPLFELMELKARDAEGYDESVDLATDVITVDIDASWNSKGRIFVRQVDPVPLTILAAIPQGFLPVGQ